METQPRWTDNSTTLLRKIAQSCYLRSQASPPDTSITNAQKLSLPANTPVGTQVSVSDGFVVSGDGDADNGFYAANGQIVNGRPSYSPLTGEAVPNNGGALSWDGIGWSNSNRQKFIGGSYPWEGAPTIGQTLTHPAIQTLAAPSTAQGGVFVAGGTQDGIYILDQLGYLINGKQAFGLFGVNTSGIDPSLDAITWSGTRWEATNDNSVLIYYSLSNVATPDLASNWKNASDDSAASITVTSVSVGELAAGVLGGNGPAQVVGNQNGRNQYADVEDPTTLTFWNLTHWERAGTSATNSNVAFPWQGTPADFTTTRDNVAAEANWSPP